MMILALYVIAAAVVAWSQQIAPVATSVLQVATVVAWVAILATITGNIGLLLGALCVNFVSVERLQGDIEEERSAGLLWWWTAAFAAVLLVGGVNAFSVTATALAILKSVLSFTYLRAARRRLAMADGQRNANV
jgi:hypothetical protein